MSKFLYSVSQTNLDMGMIDERTAWCNEQFGKGNWEWTWETNDNDFYNILEIFSFKKEQYKIWFILRWG
jgi:hypothetical protein